MIELEKEDLLKLENFDAPVAVGMEQASLPHVSIMASDEVIESLKKGAPIKVILRGKIKGYANRAHYQEVDIEVEHLSFDTENDFSRMADDEEND